MSNDDGTPRKNAAKVCVDCAALPWRDGPSPWGQGRQYPTQFRPAKDRPIRSGATPRSYRCGEHTEASERLLNPPAECAKCAALPYVAPGGAGGPGAWRPRPPRPVVYGKTKPSRRCHTHREEDLAAARTRRAEAHVLRTKGLTPEQYNRLYEAQGRKCALPRCRAWGKVKRLAVDHDRDMAVNVCGHDRDTACENCARGLVCGPHNQELLGKYAKDLQDALDYITDPPWRRLRGTA